MFALYEAGYLYSFIFNSLKIKYAEVLINLINNVILIINLLDSIIIIMIIDFKKTFFIVLFLILYCDNFFSNTNLFYIFRYFDIFAYDIARFNLKN